MHSPLLLFFFIIVIIVILTITFIVIINFKGLFLSKILVNCVCCSFWFFTQVADHTWTLAHDSSTCRNPVTIARMACAYMSTDFNLSIIEISTSASSRSQLLILPTSPFYTSPWISIFFHYCIIIIISVTIATTTIMVSIFIVVEKNQGIGKPGHLMWAPLIIFLFYRESISWLNIIHFIYDISCVKQMKLFDIEVWYTQQLLHSLPLTLIINWCVSVL